MGLKDPDFDYDNIIVDDSSNCVTFMIHPYEIEDIENCVSDMLQHFYDHLYKLKNCELIFTIVYGCKVCESGDDNEDDDDDDELIKDFSVSIDIMNQNIDDAKDDCDYIVFEESQVVNDPYGYNKLYIRNVKSVESYFVWEYDDSGSSSSEDDADR
ncbi:hypothetical protein ApNV_088 [Aratus pisonii nudivirus]|nr:hypothetical protein ApNV_088 [Aratus pisonii nudivirus]